MKRHAPIPWLAIFLVAAVLSNMGCPGKEGTFFKNMVTHFGKPPTISVYFKDTGQSKRMDVEEYLTGVVAGEMKPGWPLNAYAAQAVLARTFTMEFLGRGGTQQIHHTDISTDEKEAQAYNAAAVTPAIRKAVEMTRGLVLVYKDRYVKGWYSASCGGLTTYAREGLGYKGPEPPYMRSVKCPEQKYIPSSELHWDATLSATEVSQALKTLGKDVGTVKKMEIAKRSETKRAVLLRFQGDKGSAEVAGADFRIAVGPEKMRSIWLLDGIKSSANGIQIKGQGFGHGVGLCQWGAYALAKEGRSAKQIVSHYYPKTQITKIW